MGDCLCDRDRCGRGVYRLGLAQPLSAPFSQELPMLTRRSLVKLTLAPLIGCAGIRPSAAADEGSQGELSSLGASFAKIEVDSGGRLGVAVLDTGTGALAGHRLDERFPMCSTFKALA